MRNRYGTAVIAILLLATACSGSGTTQGDRSLLAETPGGEKSADAGSGKKAGNTKKKGGGQAGSSPAAGVGGQGSTSAGGSSAIKGDVDVPGADEEQQYPTGSAELTEPNPDAKSQGITPGYAEMTGVKIEGLGKQFRVTLTFAGDVPQQMPNDKTVMVIGFQLIRGEDEGYAFAGQATDKGWTPYAGGKEKRTKFPGSFEVTGNQIVMTVPWSFPRGAYPFKWLATSNWFQSLANTTHYKFDLVPNKDQANYPG